MRLRYSLRWFLLSVAMIAAALGLWAHRSRKQASLVRRVELAQFRIEYGPAGSTAFLARAMARMEAALGRDWVCVPVSAVAKMGCCEYEEDLRELSALRTLRSVKLCDTPTDDTSLSHLSQLRRLEKLKVSRTLVTDASLSMLGTSLHLHGLEIDNTLTTRIGVEKFQAAYPFCTVVYHDPRPPDLELKRYQALRADRVPTPEEKRKFDLASRLLVERDKLEQYKLRHELRPDGTISIEEFQAPGTHAYRYQMLRLKHTPDDDYHQQAAKVLGELGLAAGVSYIEPVVRDTNRPHWVREPVVRSLSHIADRSMIPVLIDLLDDPSPEVANTAWKMLMLSTGARFDLDPGALATGRISPEFRRELKAKWKRFWKANGELIRPRRAPTFDEIGGGF